MFSSEMFEQGLCKKHEMGLELTSIVYVTGSRRCIGKKSECLPWGSELTGTNLSQVPVHSSSVGRDWGESETVSAVV